MIYQNQADPLPLDPADTYVVVGQQVGLFPRGAVVPRSAFGEENIPRLLRLGEIVRADTAEGQAAANPAVRPLNPDPRAVSAASDELPESDNPVTAGLPEERSYVLQARTLRIEREVLR